MNSFAGILYRLALALMVIGLPVGVTCAEVAQSDTGWVSTWIASPQPPMPDAVDRYRAQTLRLIVHTSTGGAQVRIRLSNLYGDTPLVIGAARIARRTMGADIDPEHDRPMTFEGHTSVVVPAHATVLSDPAPLEIAPMTDLSVSLYLPKGADATTTHILAQQTSYVSRPGDSTAASHFPVARRIHTWPFLTGVDVAATPPTFAIVVFGDSGVDGDGSTADANRRWSDALAARLQHNGRNVAVLNAGLIGNRLLRGSPGGKPYGAALGEAGTVRFSRDALDQAGAKVVIVRMGSNDIGFPHTLAPPSESVDAADLIAGYRRLIAMAHQHGACIVGTTVPPSENADIPGYSTPAKENIRRQINEWVRHSGEFDAVLDADEVLRDPSHPTRILSAYDSGDHLHPNDAGYYALASALPLETLVALASGPHPFTRK